MLILLEQSLSNRWDDRFTENILYYVSSYLNPMYSQIIKLKYPSEYNQVLLWIQNQYYDLQLLHIEEPVQTLNTEQNEFVSMWLETSQVESHIHGDESVRNQFQTDIGLHEANSGYQSLLDYWKYFSHQVPALSKIARMVLCIPATSSLNESDFSVAGKIDSPLRANLHSESFSNLVILSSYDKPSMKVFFDSLQ